MGMDRRKFLQSTSMAWGGSVLVDRLSYGFVHSVEETPMAFTVPDLPYSHDALEPYVDQKTMELHHGQHHKAYVTNLNKAVENTDWQNKTIEDILKNISKAPPAIRNNAGGHWNHSSFWLWMKKGGGGEPAGELQDAIKRDFGSLEKFKEQFSDAGVKRFGSGWAWLIKQDGKLVIGSTPNQDNPLMDAAETKGVPISGWMCGSTLII